MRISVHALLKGHHRTVLYPMRMCARAKTKVRLSVSRACRRINRRRGPPCGPLAFCPAERPAAREGKPVARLKRVVAQTGGGRKTTGAKFNELRN